MYDTEISWTETFPILLAATFTASLSEFLSWLLIYRFDEFKQTKKSIETISKQLEREKDRMVTASEQKNQEKKIAKLDGSLKSWNQKLSMSKMKSTGIIAIFMIAFMSTLNSTYHGVVVAKLPFVPFSMLQGITHRSLPGNDYTDCSMLFIYILTSYLMRQNIQKYFGFTPRTPFSMWDQPSR